MGCGCVGTLMELTSCSAARTRWWIQWLERLAPGCSISACSPAAASLIILLCVHLSLGLQTILKKQAAETEAEYQERLKSGALRWRQR